MAMGSVSNSQHRAAAERAAFVFAACILAACERPHHTTIPHSELLALAPNVTAGRLANGLEYYVITSDETRLELGIRAGQLQEEDGQSGVATLVPDALVHSIESSGTNRDAPSTSVDGDVSEIVLSRIDDPNRDLARMRAWIGTELTEKGFAHVRRRKPEDLAGDDLVRFGGTRLMRHPWRGTKGDVRHLDLVELRRFRQRWYVPSRMTLVISGPWNRDEVAAVIEQSFSTLRDRPTPREPALVEGPRTVVAAPGCCYLRVSFLRDSPPPRTRNEMRAQLIRDVFETALLDRLREATKVWGSDAQSVSREDHWLSAHVVSYELQVVTDLPKDLSSASVARELERVRLYGFTADELRRAREQERPLPPGLVADYSYGEQHCSRSVERTVRGFLPISCDAEKKLEGELMPTISDDEINSLRSSVDPRSAAFGGISSKRGSATAPSMKLAIERALAEPIQRWTELPPLMAGRPQPGHIVRENRIADGVELWLQNGAHVLFHSATSERVTIHASSPGGALAVAAADIPAMAHVAEMVAVAGLGENDGVTTHRILEHDNVELSTSIDLRSEHVRGSSPRGAVEQLFQGLHLAMTAERVDAYSAAVTYEHQADATKLAREKLPPRLVADLDVGGSLEPSTIHALELYRQRFANAGDFTFEISGPIELARAKDLVATYIGSLPDDGRRESVAPLAVLPERTELSVGIEARYSCVLDIYWTTPMQPVSGPFDEAELWSTIVAYFVGDGVAGSAEARDALGYALNLQLFYRCKDPQHVEEQDLRERLAKLAARTFTDDEVERVRDAYESLQGSTDPDVVREAESITAADIARVLAKFQPPTEVLIVRQLR